MAAENSFDIVSKIDLQEVRNAVDQSLKEVNQRFDFKGSKSEIKLDESANEITISSDDEFKLKNLDDILQAKLIKRGISPKALTYGKVEHGLGGTAKQKITLQQGIPSDKAKEIVKAIKETKLKVQSQIQDDQVRVTGKNRDDLQSVMKLMRDKDFGIDMQFTNYR